MREVCPALIVGGFLLLAIGCGKKVGGPETINATGEVTFGNSPVEGATVTFYPADPSSGIKPAIGQTDAEGKFSLRTHVEAQDYKPGVPAGDYVVTVSKMDTSGITSTLTPPKELLPIPTTQKHTTKLRASVTAGGENHFPLNLGP